VPEPLDEIEVVQNPALGACLLWAFVREFTEATHGKRGPTIPFVMLVLPMVLHEPTFNALKTRRFDGGLLLAVAEDRTISAGLQRRLIDSSDLSLRSLNLALLSGLIHFDPPSAEFFPARKTPPEMTIGGDTSELSKAASRIGFWCASLQIEHLLSLLNVRF